MAKNFATSISPWIITMEALEPFRVESPKQDPKPLPYLNQQGKNSFDIHLEVSITPEDGLPTTISKSNFKYMYWTMAQQLTHHTSNGCKVLSGDLMGSGTISGSTPDSYGSMLELAWQGTKPVTLQNGEKRTSIEDFDTVTFNGFCEKDGVRIGFGELKTKLLPPLGG
jgi:fumarylacetoacetase